MTFQPNAVLEITRKVNRVFPINLRPVVQANIELMRDGIFALEDAASNCKIEDALTNLLSVEQDKLRLLELAGLAPAPLAEQRQANEEFRAAVDDLVGATRSHLASTLQSQCQCVNR